MFGIFAISFFKIYSFLFSQEVHLGLENKKKQYADSDKISISSIANVNLE